MSRLAAFALLAACEAPPDPEVSPEVEPTADSAAPTMDTEAPDRPSGPCYEPGVICGAAGDTSRGYNGDQTARETWLNLPTAVHLAPDGEVEFADFMNLRVRRLSSAGEVVTLVGSGFHAYAISGPALQSPLENPIDVTRCDGDDGFYLSELHGGRILHVDGEGVLSVVAGRAGEIGYAGDGGPATDALLSESGGVACGPDGEIYVSDSLNNVIRMVDTDGVITTFAGTTVGFLDGDATTAAFYRPQRLVVRDGALYVADYLNHAIRRISLATGEVTTVVGTGERGFSGDGGPATAAQLAGPNGVDVAADGTIYVADSDNHVVRRVDPDGIITTYAGKAPGPELDEDGVAVTWPGFAGNDGPATSALLNWPNDVAVGDDGRLWVADTMNSVLRTVGLP